MDVIEQFIATVRGRGLSVVLPEGGDARVIKAARRLVDDKIAQPIVLGASDEIAKAASDGGVSINGVRTINPGDSESIDAYTAAYAKDRGLNEGVARRMVTRPVVFGGMMVKL